MPSPSASRAGETLCFPSRPLARYPTTSARSLGIFDGPFSFRSPTPPKTGKMPAQGPWRQKADGRWHESESEGSGAAFPIRAFETVWTVCQWIVTEVRHCRARHQQLWPHHHRTAYGGSFGTIFPWSSRIAPSPSCRRGASAPLRYEKLGRFLFQYRAHSISGAGLICVEYCRARGAYVAVRTSSYGLSGPLVVEGRVVFPPPFIQSRLDFGTCARGLVSWEPQASRLHGLRRVDEFSRSSWLHILGPGVRGAPMPSQVVP